MNLFSIIRRSNPPAPWVEGEKIPWNDPEFSRRMLREHLSQAHDAASRRFEVIDQHVQWIHHALLAGQPGRVLDLGCGPGLYLTRLGKLGHTGLGIDFSPASIAYANQHAAGLPVEFREDDLREARFGEGYDLAMFIYGELNVFRKEAAAQILHKAWAALKPGGRLLLEVSTFESVQRTGSEPPGWFSTEQGLFSDQPHIVLTESFWDAGESVASERFYIMEGDSGALSMIAASTQAYTNEEYRQLLEAAGFSEIKFYTRLGSEGGEASDFFPITGVKSTP